MSFLSITVSNIFLFIAGVFSFSMFMCGFMLIYPALWFIELPLSALCDFLLNLAKSQPLSLQLVLSFPHYSFLYSLSLCFCISFSGTTVKSMLNFLKLPYFLSFVFYVFLSFHIAFCFFFSSQIIFHFTDLPFILSNLLLSQSFRF